MPEINEADWTRLTDTSPTMLEPKMIVSWQDRSCTECLYITGSGNLFRRRSWPKHGGMPAGVVWFIYNGAQ